MGVTASRLHPEGNARRPALVPKPAGKALLAPQLSSLSQWTFMVDGALVWPSLKTAGALVAVSQGNEHPVQRTWQ